MLDVGQGWDILRMPNNTTMLIDGGSTTVKMWQRTELYQLFSQGDMEQ